MEVTIRRACVSPDDRPFDVAERKGIGHPDSLADLVADTFSQHYARWCRREFGVVPNHWVDKVNLVGAAADVWFGGFEITKPVDCYLFGKITDRVGTAEIPVRRLLGDVVREVLPAALGDDRVLGHLRLHVNNTRGTATDHDPQFYRPGAAGSVLRVLAAEQVANDTVICVGTSRGGVAGRVAVDLERHVTNPAFRRTFPALGTDVKVMVVRVGTDLDVTAAVPVHPERVACWNDYRDLVAEVHTALVATLKEMLDGAPGVTEVRLRLNTKDSAGRGYLAPFGTALGKGDCGAVGRGNRAHGVIEPLRPSSCEAPAGKNPLHHVGKIYTAIAGEVARRVLTEVGVYAEVTIAARNGAPLVDPAHVLVATDVAVDAATARRIEQVARSSVEQAPGFAERFLGTDLLAGFREEARP